VLRSHGTDDARCAGSGLPAVGELPELHPDAGSLEPVPAGRADPVADVA
jgi:hypothetical protein